MKDLITTTVAAATVTLAGCTSLPPGAIPYSATEIEGQLSGRTWVWNNGGGLYFAPGGKALIRHEGKYYDTDWYTERGKFCHSSEGDDGPYCWSLFEKDGESWSSSLWQPEFREPYRWDAAEKTLSGNRLR